ncbi:MAG: B12-binding domain-containing radical SAM protein [Desulfobacterales bacterium]|nr:B12-binding domain-containing radical SAM protein [Desulfobacterales bacterium]
MINTDIVLVKPGSQKQLYGKLSDFQLTGIEPPLWGAILASYLRDLGFSVVLYDAEVEEWGYNETAEKIKEINPILFVILVSGSNPSASTMNMTGASQIISQVKEIAPSIITVMAGLHVSALPEQTVLEEFADFVCQGEGFYTLPPLIESLKNKTEVKNIPGLWYKKDGQVVKGEYPSLLKNLDELPMPAWDMLPMQKYRAHNWHCFDDINKRQPYAIIYTSLGCPFHCNFCCINALFGKNIIRYRSIENVISEIDYLVNEHGIRNIKIMDEMFALNEKRVVALCEKIVERKYDLNMWAYARVDTVNEKMLSIMKKAGINWVSYGIESGNKRVIRDVSKGYKFEKVNQAVEMTYKVGMHICANYIFGLPEDDYDSMNETLKLMLDINAEWSNIYCAMAYPGSELYNIAIREQMPLPLSWDEYSQYSAELRPLPTKYLSGEQILAYRDYAFNMYHTNPKYLNMINNKFGENTVQHIVEMVSNKLERKYSKPY